MQNIYEALADEAIEDSIIEEYDEFGNLIQKKRTKKFNPYKDNLSNTPKQQQLINFAGDEV